MNGEFDNELLEMFIEETRENLQTMEEGLLNLEHDMHDQETIHVIFRCMHTIKGGAGLVGLKEINHFTHQLENLLAGIRDSQIKLDSQMFQLLFTGMDVLKKVVDERDFSSEILCRAIKAIDETLEQYGDLPRKDILLPLSDSRLTANTHILNLYRYRIRLRFPPEIFELGTDPLMLIAELDSIGNILESYCDISHLPLLEVLDPHIFYLQWTIVLETDKDRDAIEQIFIFVADESELIIEPIGVDDTGADDARVEGAGADSTRAEDHLIEISRNSLMPAEAEGKSKQTDTAGSTIRVDAEKLESILNYLAELLISQSRVKELVFSYIDVADDGEKHKKHTRKRAITAGFAEVDTIIHTIQEKVMNASMLSIGGTFSRYQRMIRDLAKEIGKEVEIEIEGRETELDKRIIEQIADPLKHLIRNAMDHGLESPDDRERVGKPRAGLISLKAFHQEGNIVIQISDDGKGIDEHAIYAKALANHWIEKGQQLSKQELYMLLFQPGFSTAERVTNISGRGVGLDVVMNNIQRLRGSIDIDSELGKGTMLTIKLPLTLAIIDGMMVRVGQERYIVPLNMISEFYKEKKGNIHKAEGKGVFIHLRGENLPYVALYELLNIPADYHTPDEGILVILQHNNRKLALMVDEIVGQEQVVIKSLRENLQQQIEGIAGVTILGDGRVAIILDIPTVYTMVKRRDIFRHPTFGR